MPRQPSSILLSANPPYLIFATAIAGILLILFAYTIAEIYQLIVPILIIALLILGWMIATIPWCLSLVQWVHIFTWSLIKAASFAALAWGLWLLCFRLWCPEEYRRVVEKARRERREEAKMGGIEEGTMSSLQKARERGENELWYRG
ncbi:MAG: hypothetical protein LQ352_004417 [Teloschistes flavicans]|nr:MAG: hypothetical protein LQ352_004417 [Teloschistes flavicans]